MNLELVKEALREALKPHFNGRNAPARLDNAVDDSFNAISHMLTIREAPKKRLGVTIMTPQASMVKDNPNTTPRTI